MVTRLCRFRQDQRGLALVEGLIVFPLFLLVISAFVEFGYGVYQWNQTARAVTHGARLAAVSTPVHPNYLTLDDDMTGLLGTPVPATIPSLSCVGAGTSGTVCNDAFSRILLGSDGVCNPNFGVTTPGICDFNPQIKAENVKVTYTRAGLGYQGRRLGPVVSVTVELQDLYFRFFWVAALLGIDSVPVPTSPATFVGEDLANCAIPLADDSDTFASPC